MKKILITILLLTISSLSFANEILRESGYKLIQVTDGDTITIQKGTKKPIKVRLLGIQAPELYTDPIWDYAQEAKDEVKRVLKGKSITIEYVKSHKRDKYKRVLADIYVDNLWLNGYMVEKGLAFVYILYDSKIPKIKELLEIEKKARQKNIPFWQNKNYAVINVENAKNYLNSYKLVKGTILRIEETTNSIWLQMESIGNKGFSIRIAKKNTKNKNTVNAVNTSVLNIPSKSLLHKEVIVRGFIEKYSPNFGAMIKLQNEYSLQVLP